MSSNIPASNPDVNPPPRRLRRLRRLWWLWWLAVPALAVLAWLAWLFAPDIERALAPRPTPLPQAAEQAPGILFETTFAEPDAAQMWQLFNDGRISAALSDDRLVVAVSAPEDAGGWSGLNLSFSDFELEVDAQRLDGSADNGIIVTFRVIDPQNYHRFEISSDGYYALSTVQGGVPRIVSEFRASPAIDQAEGAVNRIQVRAVGDRFSFAVNDVPLELCVSDDPAVAPLWEAPADPASACLGGQVAAEWQDAAFPAGQLGLGAQAYSGFDGEQDTPALAVIAFDNLVIRSAAP